MSLFDKIEKYLKHKAILDFCLFFLSTFLALFCVVSLSYSEFKQNDFFGLIILLFTLGIISNSLSQNYLNKKYAQNFLLYTKWFILEGIISVLLFLLFQLLSDFNFFEPIAYWLFIISFTIMKFSIFLIITIFKK